MGSSMYQGTLASTFGQSSYGVSLRGAPPGQPLRELNALQGLERTLNGSIIVLDCNNLSGLSPSLSCVHHSKLGLF